MNYDVRVAQFHACALVALLQSYPTDGREWPSSCLEQLRRPRCRQVVLTAETVRLHS